MLSPAVLSHLSLKKISFTNLSSVSLPRFTRARVRAFLLCESNQLADKTSCKDQGVAKGGLRKLLGGGGGGEGRQRGRARERKTPLRRNNTSFLCVKAIYFSLQWCFYCANQISWLTRRLAKTKGVL